MSPKIKINLVTSNHRSLIGINDCILILSGIAKSRNIEIRTSNNFQTGHLNFIIDEFTDETFITNFLHFKNQHPSEKFILIATEFVETFCGITSINIFKRLSCLAYISYANIWIIWKYPYLKKNLSLLDLVNLIIFIPYLPATIVFFFMEIFRKGVKSSNFNFHQTVYNYLRYLGLKKCISQFDCVVAMSEDVITTMNEHFTGVKSGGVFYPEINDLDLDKLFKNKALRIDFSGTVTSYRKSEFTKIERYLHSFSEFVQSINVISFNEKSDMEDYKIDNDGKRSAFSFHPPQQSNWIYCSPTRIFRAFNIENNIPCLSRHFQQHPIEDCCIKLNSTDDLYKAYSIYNRIEPHHTEYLRNIHSYSKISKKLNDQFITKLSEWI